MSYSRWLENSCFALVVLSDGRCAVTVYSLEILITTGDTSRVPTGTSRSRNGAELDLLSSYIAFTRTWRASNERPLFE